MERMFPEGHLHYGHMTMATINVPRFQRFIAGIRALERTRVLMDSNRSWIGEDVSLGGTDHLRGFLENLEQTLRIAGWKEASTAALYHVTEDLGFLRAAVLLVFPTSSEMSAEKAIYTLVEDY